MRLEGVLDEIAAAAGRDAAMTMARHYGGTVVRVPTTAKALSTQPWCRKLTEEAAAAIGKEFAGQNIYIPLANRQVACWLLEQGLSAANVAAELRVTVRAVERWRK